MAQIVQLSAETINACLTLGLNKYVGIPNIILYFLGGSFALSFDKGGMFFVSCIIFSKMTPPGIESTMYSAMDTLYVMWVFILKQYMGVLINKHFIHVNNENLNENYIYLKLITIFTSLIPFLYI